MRRQPHDVFLRINGYQITVESQAIFSTLMQFLDHRTFDLEHLVPWLESIVAPATQI